MIETLTPLTETQAEVQRLARDFARRELAPHTAAWDKAEAMPPEVLRKLGELGFLGMLLPEEYGGMGLDSQDRKSTRLNSSHVALSRMPSSA